MRAKILLTAAILVVVVIGLLLLLTVFRDGGGPDESGKLRVSASFYPAAEFARQVGRDRVDVSTLVSPGVEPHDYDPTAREVARVHESAIFIYNGAGLEPWADKLAGELAAGGVVVVEASDGIALMTGVDLQEDEPEEDTGGGASFDPHVWLDPVLAARQVDNVMDGLIQADPGNEAEYESNAAAFKQELEDLDGAYRSGLSSCERKDIITSHQAFRYLAARYGLEVVAIAGLSPDEEPSPQKLAEVARFARERNVGYIFFETLASPRLSETIAREVGAQTLVFNPLEGLSDQEIASGQSYISVQRENLANLQTALGCG